MARLDWHAGKFSADAETKRIFEGMEGWASRYGDWVNYYRLDQAATQFDDVYEEVTDQGRIYKPMRRVPAMHVTHVRGANEWNDKGFYVTDDLDAIMSFQQFTQCGLVMADIDTNNYDMDRIVYDEKVFRIKEIAVRGKIQTRAIVITINATQLKPDEMVEDQQMSNFIEAWQ